MKLLTLNFLVLFLFWNAKVDAQESNNFDLIDNRAYSYDSIYGMPSFEYYRPRYLKISFNLGNSIVLEKFDSIITRLKAFVEMDSLVFTSYDAEINNEHALYVGENIPFYITQNVLEVLLKEPDPDFYVVLVKNDYSGRGNGEYQHRKMSIGGRCCFMKWNSRWLVGKNVLERLLTVKSQKEFIDFFDANTVYKNELLLEYERLKNYHFTLKEFSKIADYHKRIKASKNKLDEYFSTSIVKELNNPDREGHNYIFILDLDENGKVTSVTTPQDFFTLPEIKVIEKYFTRMPKWETWGKLEKIAVRVYF